MKKYLVCYSLNKGEDFVDFEKVVEAFNLEMALLRFKLFNKNTIITSIKFKS